MRVMLSCGEASGDLYAAALAHELRQRDPGVDVFGFGGPRLRSAGARLVGEFAGLSVTGLTEALRVVPRALGMVRALVRAAHETRPDVFVAIDFPDFNFRLMQALRRLRIPVVYYVSPQLWAWRPGRMRTMKASVDRVLVIFPFEEAIYRRASVPVTFVGHPLVDLAVPRTTRTALLSGLGLDPAAPTVALLPGSRPNEVHRIAPTLAEAVPLIRGDVPDVQFVVARAPGLPDELFAPFAASSQLEGRDGARPAGRTPLAVLEGATDDVLAGCDIAITASGTATVQCALHERPMVVVYRLSALSYTLGKPFVKVDTYAMANLVAGERVVPELIQSDFTPARVAAEATAFLVDRERYERARRALSTVRERLGAPGASGRAADAVLDVARARRAGLDGAAVR
jgi:lipid-A-disaccharide synthase